MESRQVRRAKMRKEAPMLTEVMANGHRKLRRMLQRLYATAWWQEREGELEARMSGSTTAMEDEVNG